MGEVSCPPKAWILYVGPAHEVVEMLIYTVKLISPVMLGHLIRWAREKIIKLIQDHGIYKSIWSPGEVENQAKSKKIMCHSLWAFHFSCEFLEFPCFSSLSTITMGFILWLKTTFTWFFLFSLLWFWGKALLWYYLGDKFVFQPWLSTNGPI